MPKSFNQIEYFVIGVSAGGVDILKNILPAFQKNSRFKVFVVLHLPPAGPNLIPSLMGPLSQYEVTEAMPGEDILTDHIYIAPPDYHMCIEPNNIITLSTEEPVNFSRPSIDILFESAAYAFGKKTLGILLTGANNDGAEGLRKIQEAGGMTVVQDPADAEYSTMPQSALDIMEPDYVLDSDRIVEMIRDLSTKGNWNA